MKSNNEGIRTIVVGSRKSALALQQTGMVIADLKRICAEQQQPFDFVVKTFVTTGDRILDVNLAKLGGKGLFVNEMEQSLLESEIDLAVHSMKDMPAKLPEGLTIGAVPERADARDALLSRSSEHFMALPRGAKVGTSSLRRAAQLLAVRPDLHVLPLRGNIDTRLRKLQGDTFDAIVLAAAGLQRMGWEHHITEYFAPDVCLPAVAQGALALECRSTDTSLLELLAQYEHEPSRSIVDAERTFLQELNGGCQLPIAGYATLMQESDQIQLTGLVMDAGKQIAYRYTAAGSDPIAVGKAVAQQVILQGAGRLLAEWKG